MDKMDLILEELQDMKKEISGINNRLDNIENRLDNLEEGQEEIRTACNVLIDWAEKASEVRDLPLPKIG